MAAASSDCWHGIYLRFAIYDPLASDVLANVTCARRLSGGLRGFKDMSPKDMLYIQSYHSGVVGPLQVDLDLNTRT